MTATATGRWTIKELASRAAVALSQAQLGQHSGRVREIPDARTIRYYTTLGLIDRPHAYQGRTALYGSRHLLQLVAIKRLQAQGVALAVIQERLIGQPDGALEAVAGMPAGWRRQADEAPAAADAAQIEGEGQRGAALVEGDAADAADTALAEGEGRRGAAFWEATPAEAAPAREARPVSERGGRRRPRAVALRGVALGPEVTLMLGPRAQALDDDDLEAIAVAAEPLLQLLRARELAPNDDEE